MSAASFRSAPFRSVPLRSVPLRSAAFDVSHDEARGSPASGSCCFRARRFAPEGLGVLVASMRRQQQTSGGPRRLSGAMSQPRLPLGLRFTVPLHLAGTDARKAPKAGGVATRCALRAVLYDTLCAASAALDGKQQPKSQSLSFVRGDDLRTTAGATARPGAMAERGPRGLTTCCAAQCSLARSLAIQAARATDGRRTATSRTYAGLEVRPLRRARFRSQRLPSGRGADVCLLAGGAALSASSASSAARRSALPRCRRRRRPAAASTCQSRLSRFRQTTRRQRSARQRHGRLVAARSRGGAELRRAWTRRQHGWPRV